MDVIVLAIVLTAGGAMLTARWAIVLIIYMRLAQDGNRWGAEGLAKLVRALRPPWP
jgi:hypothetical protein